MKTDITTNEDKKLQLYRDDNGLIGIKNTQGKVIVSPEYEDYEIISNKDYPEEDLFGMIKTDTEHHWEGDRLIKKRKIMFFFLQRNDTVICLQKDDEQFGYVLNEIYDKYDKYHIKIEEANLNDSEEFEKKYENEG